MGLFQAAPTPTCHSLLLGASYIEKVDHACLQRILGANHGEMLFLNYLLEKFGAVPEMVHRNGDVGANRGVYQCLHIVAKFRLQQNIDGRTYSIDNRAQIRRLIFSRLLEFLQCRQDGAAVRMSHDDYKPRVIKRRGVFDAAYLRWRDDVAGDANYEQVAKTAVEYYFRGNSCVRTAEYYRERILILGQLRTPLTTDERTTTSHARHEFLIATLEAFQCLLC